QGPRPGDRLRIQAERVAVIDARVDGRGEEVVGGLYGVQVAVQVKVDLLHRDDLGVTAAGSAALYPEDRTHRRFADAERDVRPDLPQPLGETHRCGGLALSRLGRRHRRRDDQLAV